jgi:hypothetical protein
MAVPTPLRGSIEQMMMVASFWNAWAIGVIATASVPTSMHAMRFTGDAILVMGNFLPK